MKKIILVEDDPDIQEVFAASLDSSIYAIVSYVSGAPILEEQVEAPDLFVLDKNISGFNGLTICRFIKNSPLYKHIPVLLLSASPDIMEAAKEAGADGAIAKPFSLKILRETIASQVGR